MTRQASNHPARSYILWPSRPLAVDSDGQEPEVAHGEVGDRKLQVIMTLPRMR